MVVPPELFSLFLDSVAVFLKGFAVFLGTVVLDKIRVFLSHRFVELELFYDYAVTLAGSQCLAQIIHIAPDGLLAPLGGAREVVIPDRVRDAWLPTRDAKLASLEVARNHAVVKTKLLILGKRDLLSYFLSKVGDFDPLPGVVVVRGVS